MRGHALKLSMLVALSVAAVATACSDDGNEEPAATPAPTTAVTQTAAPQEVQLTQSDDGVTVELADGGTLIVALPSNPSTGYSWSVGEQSSPQLVLQGEPAFVPAGSTTQVIGAGGTEVFTFEASGTGEAALTLEYRRPFEPGALPEDTFGVTVTIR